jgi:hypothetical protein
MNNVSSRSFSIVDDVYLKKYDEETFICDVMFIDESKGPTHVAYVSFIRKYPEGNFHAIDQTYFFTNLEILKMKDQARKLAYPKIEHLFDHNELKKFYERKPEIDKELANELRKEEEERERIRKLRIIFDSLADKITDGNIDLAINEYRNIEQSLNEDEKKFIKKVFYFYITEARYKDITKIELLLDLNLIESQKIIASYHHRVIPLDILELILSRSNEKIEYAGRFFEHQFDLIKDDRVYTKEKKENLSNNLKILLDKYNINYN